MKLFVTLVFIVFVALWLMAITLFAGIIPTDWLPGALAKLSVSNSFEGVGNAMATLDGLFSSIAILLGLIAILLQGRELKASTQAQTEQSEALSQQLLQQVTSNKLGAYSARLQFLSAEIEHMESRIPGMLEKAADYKQKQDQEQADKMWELIRNTRRKIERYRTESTQIDEKIRSLLSE